MPEIHAVDRIFGLNSTRSPIEAIYLASQPVPVLVRLDLGGTSVDQRDLTKDAQRLTEARKLKGASQKQLGLGRRLRLTGREGKKKAIAYTGGSPKHRVENEVWRL